VGGWFTSIGGQARNYIARLNADGTVDPGFNPDVSSYANSIAVQADGKILVGGAFDSIGGQDRNYIARLSSAEAALQELSAEDNTRIEWARTGAGPELYDVWLESSADLSNWSALGAGARITGGWEITGLSLPDTTNIYIRARGYAWGGSLNGSGSIVESVRNVFFTVLTGAAGEPMAQAYTLQLMPAAPNPAGAGRTRFLFTLPAESMVSLDVYNVLGQRVASLARGKHAAGRHTVGWDGTDHNGSKVVSGVYLYQLKTEGRTLTRRMTVVR
jgi:hypothetical protein